MSATEESNDTNWRQRGLLLVLVAILVLFGAGIGSFILGDSPPAAGNETTPTPTAIVTPTPTSTPDDGGPTTTSAPTAMPTGTETATPEDDTETPTETPDDDPDTPTPTPTATPTEVSGGGGNTGGGGGPTTPSPGLELGDDGPLLSTANVAPGDGGQGTLTIRNGAGEDGELTISAIDIVDEENGIVDPEADVDSSPNEGELSESLEVRISIEDAAGDRVYLLGTDGGYVTLSDLPSRIPSAEYALASGEAVTLVTDWRLPQSTGNIVQSDGASFDVGLTLQSTD